MTRIEQLVVRCTTLMALRIELRKLQADARHVEEQYGIGSAIVCLEKALAEHERELELEDDA